MPYSAQVIVKKILISLLIAAFLLPFSVKKISAEDQSMGVAVYLSMTEDAPSGSLIAFSDKGYVLNRIPYNPLIVGIATEKPAIAIGQQDESTAAVISSGNAYVRVSGKINVGDLLTGSSIPGVAQKAAHSGYVIGSALEDFTPANAKDIGNIAISLNIHYFTSSVRLQNNLLDLFSIGSVATYEQPTTVFKYLVAGFVVVLSFIFGFYLFARTANKGIDALGRNPLAGRMIQFGIFLNVAITITVFACGIIVAYLVLRL